MGLMDEYQVGIDGPWGDEEASHLYRRAGFGATPAERAAVVGGGAQQDLRNAVDALVNFAPSDPHLDRPAGTGTGVQGDPLADLPDDLSDLGQVKTPIGLRAMQGHWLYRMRYTSQPLQEQYTLFLHDHMVSEYAKVSDGIQNEAVFGNDGSAMGQQCTGGTLAPDPLRRNRIVTELMLTQNYRYRMTGMDDFRQLLLDISRNPCMLIYLDNMLNLKGRPQENFAREVMELFSMGVDNYSENDVQEVAKVSRERRSPCADARTIIVLTCTSSCLPPTSPARKPSLARPSPSAEAAWRRSASST